MKRFSLLTGMILTFALISALAPSGQGQKSTPSVLNCNVPPLATDKSIKYDYDIVYVRTPDAKGSMVFAEVNNPLRMNPGADLVLLHPDGTEEVLDQGGKGAIIDPMVSFDGEWVYYSKIHEIRDLFSHLPPLGADIYKVHVKTKKIVRLTHQGYTPNTGAVRWLNGVPKSREDEAKDFLTAYGTYNTGPCPLPGGKIVFTSNRNCYIPPKHPSPCLQLFVMDEDGSNVEQIGHLNLGMALHPVVLMDGRIMFSSLESQGMRQGSLWGLWSINPDGTNWGPLMSAFNYGSAALVTHFQTQLSRGDIVIEEYYQLNNWGFGTYFKFPTKVPEGVPAFGPGNPRDPRNPQLMVGRYDNGQPMYKSLPFSPYGIVSLTPMAGSQDNPASLSEPGNLNSPRAGKFTQPAAAPDNHMLTTYSLGPVNANGVHKPFPDPGIYLIKDGNPVHEPAQMRLVKNDPSYIEQWPRAVVPYKRIYGMDEPKRLPRLANDGTLSKHLPEGTPYGLVGTSSFYKRETYPEGTVPPGKVTAEFSGDDPSGAKGLGMSLEVYSLNWGWQGADAGLYSNSDIHAVRILAMEPQTDRNGVGGAAHHTARGFQNHAMERLRILGEIPLRKFGKDGKHPLDLDGNPDTSFLAKIPADMVWTFQTLDKNGMVLNFSQTWHQLRPGEIRNDCGGCHAHSQKPTLFKDTLAAKPDYEIFDLSQRTSLLTSKPLDESGKKWDESDETGLRYESGIKNVEYFRDVKPILERSCVACHTKDQAKAPPNQWLVMDDDASGQGYPGAYWNFVLNPKVKPTAVNARSQYTYSRYINEFQARRSLLIWKIYGKRMDGFTNDDFPSPTVPGDPDSLMWKGKKVGRDHLKLVDIDYTGGIMPPPDAVKGAYLGPNGQKIKVEPLTDEDRRTLVRWIDLGCPLDFTYNPQKPNDRGTGWMLDDNRPTLAVTYPQPNANPPLTRILVGMDDFYSGLDVNSFEVTADFPVDSTPAGRNLAPLFREKSQGVYELKLGKPITELPKGKLTVSIRDRQGNVTRVDRTFSVSASKK